MNKTSLLFRLHRRLPRSLALMQIIVISGIAVACAVLMVTIGIVNGFKRDYKRAILDFNAHIVVLKDGEMEEGTLEEANEKGVVGSTPFLYRESLAVSGGVIRGLVLKGVDAATLRDVNKMNISLIGGASLDSALSNGLILGSELAKKFSPNGKGLPDKIKLLAAQNRFIEIPMTGTFESGLYDYDSQFALIGIAKAREIFRAGKIAATGVELKLSDPDAADSIANLLNEKLPPQYQAIPWSELNHDIFEALSLERLLFTIIMGILVLVASFNLISLVALLLLHRGHEVSILTALGLRTKDIKNIFSAGGAGLGLMGASSGIAVGAAIAWFLKRFIKLEPEIYFLQSLPIDISWPICGMIIALTVLLCWLTSSTALKSLKPSSIAEGLKH